MAVVKHSYEVTMRQVLNSSEHEGLQVTLTWRVIAGDTVWQHEPRSFGGWVREQGTHLPRPPSSSLQTERCEGTRVKPVAMVESC